MKTRRDRYESITPAAIETVVQAFYERVQADTGLGPVFARHVDDWPPHLARMNTFWRSVLLSTHEFQRSPRGAPPVLHRAITDLSTDHFARWIDLFAQTARETLAPEPAQAWIDKAMHIGTVLSRHLRPGTVPITASGTR